MYLGSDSEMRFPLAISKEELCVGGGFDYENLMNIEKFSYIKVFAQIKSPSSAQYHVDGSDFSKYFFFHSLKFFPIKVTKEDFKD